jgi:hypothetical protein
MIKLFRNIRKNLLAEGKTRRYFKYAIGEIILVVIGILIALSINNGNEDRKSRKQELKYLKNLRTDIELELKNNNSMSNYRAVSAKAAARMLDFKTLETASDLLALEQTIQQVYARVNFIPTNNTYKELISSGNLNYITNDSIKYNLLELDKMYVSIALFEHHMYREYEEYLYNVSVFNGEMLNLLDIQKTVSTGLLTYNNSSQIPIDTAIPDYNQLLKKKEYRNGLKLAAMNNVGLKNHHASMTHRLQKLIGLINNELHKD